jgi:nitronate monooxygenase
MGGFALIPQVVDIVKLPVIAAGGIADGRGLAAAFALGAEGVQIGTAFLPCAGSGASEAYRAALSSFAANGTDLTDAFTGRLARGIKNRLMNEFRHVSSPPLPFPLQHALTQTVAAPASAQGASELMTIWAGQNASLCHSTDATEFMTQLITEAETVFSKNWEAVSPVRETTDEDESR